MERVGVEGDGSPGVVSFLETFQRASRELDLDALRGCFAEIFLAGDASGSRPVPRQAFLEALPARAAAAAAAGVGRAALRSATAVMLDDRWTLLRTTWAAPREGGGELPMASSFLLHREGDQVRAAAYLSHEGLPQTLS